MHPIVISGKYIENIFRMEKAKSVLSVSFQKISLCLWIEQRFALDFPLRKILATRLILLMEKSLNCYSLVGYN